MNGSSYPELSLSQKRHKWKRQCPYSVFGGRLTSPCILFCSLCWMYYSVIPKKLDKGEAGMLGTAGDFPARRRGFKERWRKKDSNIENAFLKRTIAVTSAEPDMSLLRHNFDLSSSLRKNPIFSQQQYDVPHKLKDLYLNCDQKQEANYHLC